MGLLEGHHHPFAPQLAAGDPVGLVGAPAAPEGGGGRTVGGWLVPSPHSHIQQCNTGKAHLDLKLKISVWHTVRRKMFVIKKFL